MTRSDILDLYFLEARSRVIDLAAFLDRVQRGENETNDYRMTVLRAAIGELGKEEPGAAQRVLNLLSDPTREPTPTAGRNAAAGAWQGPKTTA